MPELTIASAMPRIKVSLTEHPKEFHEFQPIGGVAAMGATAEAAGAEAGAGSASADDTGEPVVATALSIAAVARINRDLRVVDMNCLRRRPWRSCIASALIVTERDDWDYAGAYAGRYVNGSARLCTAPTDDQQRLKGALCLLLSAPAAVADRTWVLRERSRAAASRDRPQ